MRPTVRFNEFGAAFILSRCVALPPLSSFYLLPSRPPPCPQCAPPRLIPSKTTRHSQAILNHHRRQNHPRALPLQMPSSGPSRPKAAPLAPRSNSSHIPLPDDAPTSVPPLQAAHLSILLVTRSVPTCLQAREPRIRGSMSTVCLLRSILPSHHSLLG